MADAPFPPSSFPHRRAGHCGSGALRDLLEHRGLDFGVGPLSEGAVFGLAGGLGFMSLEIHGPEPSVYLVGRSADLERDLARHLEIGLDVRETDDPSQGWQWVRDEIDAGRPPMIWADIGHLDYLRVCMHNTRHDIVVVDYDEDAGVAWIADNDRDGLQACSLMSLARARSSDAFPGANRHTTFIYDWPERLPDPRRAVHAAIRRAMANMRETPTSGPLARLPGAVGLEGVGRFAAAYAAWPAIFGEDLAKALDALRVFIVKAGTGGAMFRSLQATFFHDMGDVLHDRGLWEIAGNYDALAAAWRALAANAQRYDHAGGLEPVSVIEVLEPRGVQMMETWLAGQRT